MNLEYLVPAFSVGDACLYLSIEPSGPSERRIDGAGSVCSSDHYHCAAFLQAIHESEKLRDERRFDSHEALARQIAADVEAARQWFRRAGEDGRSLAPGAPPG